MVALRFLVVGGKLLVACPSVGLVGKLHGLRRTKQRLIAILFAFRTATENRCGMRLLTLRGGLSNVPLKRWRLAHLCSAFQRPS
jgi:hypothetical protein